MGRFELEFSQPECSALTTTLWDTHYLLEKRFLGQLHAFLDNFYGIHCGLLYNTPTKQHIIIVIIFFYTLLFKHYSAVLTKCWFILLIPIQVLCLFIFVCFLISFKQLVDFPSPEKI